jgi:hypothetical protein
VLLKVGVEHAQDLVLQAQDPPLDGRQMDRVAPGRSVARPVSSSTNGRGQ